MRRQDGFSAIELMIVVTVLVPILASIASMGSVVTSTVNANDRGSEIVEALRRTMQRIGGVLRPARLSSFEVRANADDVALGRAAAVGEWISPTDLSPRQGVRFVTAEGLLSMNAMLSTPPRELWFALESGEAPNGVDDDGDGLIDEGRIEFLYGAERVLLARDLELCEFELDGRLVRATLRGAKRDARGNVHRSTVSQSFYVRNN